MVVSWSCLQTHRDEGSKKVALSTLKEMMVKESSVFEKEAAKSSDTTVAWAILQACLGQDHHNLDVDSLLASLSTPKLMAEGSDSIPVGKSKDGGEGRLKRSRSKSSGDGGGGGSSERIHGRSTVLSQEVRQRYIDWCRDNTMMRGDSLTTSFRAVAAFVSKMLGRCQGVDASSIKPMSLKEVKEFVETHEAALNDGAREALNSSLATFWRHFLRFLNNDTGRGGSGGARGNRREEGGQKGSGGPSLRAGASGDGDDVGAGEEGQETEDASYGGMSFEEDTNFEEEGSDEQTWAGGRGDEREDQSSSLRGLASAAAMYKRPSSAPKKPSRNRVTPYVINPPTRQAFSAWMMRNTRMQGASMMTAMRTANRVVAQLLLRHSPNKPRPGDPNRFVEHTFEELRSLAEVHGDEVTRELERTASMSIQTFWRHFARFLMGQEEPAATGSNPGGGPGAVVNTPEPVVSRNLSNVGVGGMGGGGGTMAVGMSPNTIRQQPDPIYREPQLVTGGNEQWFVKDRWQAAPPVPAVAGPSGAAMVPAPASTCFSPLTIAHIEQIKRGEVIDSRLLQKFEAWLTESCYVPTNNAWMHCRDLNELVRMVLTRESSGLFIPDSNTAFTFLNMYEQHPLVTERSRIVKRFHDFLLQGLQPQRGMGGALTI